jgi:hypothetical protein
MPLSVAYLELIVAASRDPYPEHIFCDQLAVDIDAHTAAQPIAVQEPNVMALSFPDSERELH